jgi:hypothetical protein
MPAGTTAGSLSRCISKAGVTAEGSQDRAEIKVKGSAPSLSRKTGETATARHRGVQDDQHNSAGVHLQSHATGGNAREGSFEDEQREAFAELAAFRAAHPESAPL